MSSNVVVADEDTSPSAILMNDIKYIHKQGTENRKYDGSGKKIERFENRMNWMHILLIVLLVLMLF